MPVDSLFSPLPMIFLAVMAAFLAARRLSGGGSGGDVALRLRVSKLEAEVRRLQQSAGQAPSGSSDDDVRHVARTEGTIAAIKLVRERTGMGLKEAKDHVEALLAGNPPSQA